MGKVVAIIQARMGSSRLPGKVLMDIAGRPMIDHVIERALAIDGVDKVVLNVPERDVSAFLDVRERYPHEESYAIIGVPNQELDVLGSYLACAVAEKADVVMRITGDTPLLCPFICADVLKLYQRLNDPMIYCANDTTRSGWPDGTDCEVFSVQALRAAVTCSSTAHEREHVTTWIRSELPNYGVLIPHGREHALKNVKWSVDTEADLAVVRGIHEYLAPGKFSVTETAWAHRAMMQDIEAAQEKN